MKQDPNNPTVLEFLKSQRKRMGIPESEAQTFNANMYLFSNAVRGIESDYRLDAKSPTTTAKGVYQFTDDSVITAKNRMKNMGIDQKYIDAMPQDPRQWNDEQSDMAFYANMFGQTGSDNFLKKIAKGDSGAMKEAYYKFHHTNPDKKTIARTDEFINADTMAAANNMIGVNPMMGAMGGMGAAMGSGGTEEAEEASPSNISTFPSLAEINNAQKPFDSVPTFPEGFNPFQGEEQVSGEPLLSPEAQSAAEVAGMVGFGEPEEVGQEIQESIDERDLELEQLMRDRGLGVQDANSDVQEEYKRKIEENKQSGIVDPNYKATAYLAANKWSEKINYTPDYPINGVLDMLERVYEGNMFDQNNDLTLNKESLKNFVYILDAQYNFFNPNGYLDSMSRKLGFTFPEGMSKENIVLALLHQDISYKLGTWNVDPTLRDGSNQSELNPMGINNPEYMNWIETYKDNDVFEDIKNGLEIIQGYRTGNILSPLMSPDGSGMMPLTNSQKDESLDDLQEYGVFEGTGRLSPSRQYFSDPEEIDVPSYIVEGFEKTLTKSLNLFGLAYDPVVLDDEGPDMGLGFEMAAYALPTVGIALTTRGLGGGALATTASAGFADAMLQMITPREENMFNLLQMVGEQQVISDMFEGFEWSTLSYFAEQIEEQIANSDLIELMTIREGNSKATNALIGILEGAAMGTAVTTGFGALAAMAVVTAKGVGLLGKGLKVSGKGMSNLAQKLGDRFGWTETEKNLFAKGMLELNSRATNFYSGLPLPEMINLIRKGGRGLSMIINKYAGRDLGGRDLVDFTEHVKVAKEEIDEMITALKEGDYGDEEMLRGEIDKLFTEIDAITRNLQGDNLPPQIKTLISQLDEAKDVLSKKHKNITGESYGGRAPKTYLEGRGKIYRDADDWLRSWHLQREYKAAADGDKDMLEKINKRRRAEAKELGTKYRKWDVEDAAAQLVEQEKITQTLKAQFESPTPNEKTGYGGHGKGNTEEGLGTTEGNLYRHLEENYGYKDEIGPNPDYDFDVPAWVRDEPEMEVQATPKVEEEIEIEAEPEVSNLEGKSLSELRKYVKDNDIKDADGNTPKARDPKTLQKRIEEAESSVKQAEELKAKEAKKKKAETTVKIAKKQKAKPLTEYEQRQKESLTISVEKGRKRIEEGRVEEVTPKMSNRVVARIAKERLIDIKDYKRPDGSIDYDYINNVEPDPAKRIVELEEEITLEIETAKIEANGKSFEEPERAKKLRSVLDRLLNKLNKFGLSVEDVGGDWIKEQKIKSLDELLGLGKERGLLKSQGKEVPELVPAKPKAKKAKKSKTTKPKPTKAKVDAKEDVEEFPENISAAEQNRRDELNYEEAELDDLAETEKVRKGKQSAAQAVTSRIREFIQAREAYATMGKGTPKETRELIEARLLKSFIMMQRVLAKMDLVANKGTQKGFMARKVLPPMEKAGDHALIAWGKKHMAKGYLSPENIFTLTKGYNMKNVEGKKAGKLFAKKVEYAPEHSVGEKGIDAMANYVSEHPVLRTRRIHRPLNPLGKEKFFLSMPRIAQLLKDFGNSGLVSGIGTQFAAAQGAFLYNPRKWWDNISLWAAAKGNGSVAEMAREVRKLEEVIKSSAKDKESLRLSKKELIQKMRKEMDMPESPITWIQKLFIPSADNVYVVRGLEERGAQLDNFAGSKDETLKVKFGKEEYDVPTAGLTSLGFAAAEVEGEAARRFWLGAAAVQEGMARVVMSGFIDKGTKNFGGGLHTRELLKELVSQKQAANLDIDEVGTVEMLRALREWNTGRAGGTIGFDVRQDKWMKDRLGLWVSKGELPKKPDDLSEEALERWHKWQTDGAPDGKEVADIRKKLDTMYEADQSARSRMEELTLQHEKDIFATSFQKLSQNPWTGLFAKFGKTSANTMTMGIESTPVLGIIWRKLNKANSTADVFNSYSKQAAFATGMVAFNTLLKDAVKDKWTLGERGEVRFRVNVSEEKIKEKCLERFQSSPELLSSMTKNYNQFNDEELTEQEYLEDVLWGILKPEKNESTMTYDRAGFVGNCLNVMVRSAWLMQGYSPRYSFKELEQQGFSDGIVAELGKLAIVENGTSYASDIYKNVYDLYESEDSLEAAVNLLFLNRAAVPVSGLAGDVARLVDADTANVQTDVRGEPALTAGLRKATGISSFFDDLPPKYDFFGMPMETDEYSWRTALLGREDYETTWYEDVFEEMALDMRALPPYLHEADTAEGQMAEYDVNTRDFTFTDSETGAERNGYEMLNQYVVNRKENVTMYYRRKDGNGNIVEYTVREAANLNEQARNYFDSNEFKARRKLVMAVRTWTDEQIEENKEQWIEAMEARDQIREVFRDMRTDRITRLKERVQDSSQIGNKTFAWMHDSYDENGQSLYDAFINAAGYEQGGIGTVTNRVENKKKEEAMKKRVAEYKR